LGTTHHLHTTCTHPTILSKRHALNKQISSFLLRLDSVITTIHTIHKASQPHFNWDLPLFTTFLRTQLLLAYDRRRNYRHLQLLQADPTLHPLTGNGDSARWDAHTSLLHHDHSTFLSPTTAHTGGLIPLTSTSHNPFSLNTIDMLPLSGLLPSTLHAAVNTYFHNTIRTLHKHSPIPSSHADIQHYRQIFRRNPTITNRLQTLLQASAQSAITSTIKNSLAFELA
jgi:hypothetical protein